MTVAEQKEFLTEIETLADYEHYNKLEYAFPKDGPFAISKYGKHMEFIRATKEHNQVAFMAANQVGKSLLVSKVVACHATGKYPDDWEGRKFDKPLYIWSCGKSPATVKDVNQDYLLGDFSDMGSGLLPKDDIVDWKKKQNSIGNLLEYVTVKHYTNGKYDGVSTIKFRTYEENPESYQGSRVDVIHIDEEPKNPNLYSEAFTRTITTNGLMLCSFTPLQGLSVVATSFLEDGAFPAKGSGPVRDPESGTCDKYVVNCTWDDVPHLADDAKKNMLAAYLPHEKEARSKGIPSIGSGRVYPILEGNLVVPNFDIPPTWPRAFGLDVGWNNTAIVWGAIDPNTGVMYIYAEYKEGQKSPAEHAHVIKSVGKWIRGVVDPASQQSNQKDGTQLLSLYNRELDVSLVPAVNKRDVGIAKVYHELSTGQLKFFESCQKLLGEYRLYGYNAQGKIKDNQNDHLLDALRYLVMSGKHLATINPAYEDEEEEEYSIYSRGGNEVTGY